MIWGYCDVCDMCRVWGNTSCSLSLYLSLRMCLLFCVCFYVTAYLCACVCVCDMRGWERKMRRVGDGGNSKQKRYKGYLWNNANLVLDKMKKKNSKSCKGVNDVLIFQTTWFSCYFFLPIFQVPSNLKNRRYIYFSLSLLTNEDSSQQDGNSSFSKLF